MTKYLALILLLLGNLVTYSMDDTVLDSSSEGYESCEEVTYFNGEDKEIDDLVSILNKYVTKSNINEMPLFADIFGSSEINFTPEICKAMKCNISVIYFPELMNLLRECRTMVVTSKGEHYSHINKKSYSAEQLVSMLNMIDYLEIVWLREPLLNKLLGFLMAFSKNEQYKLRNDFIQNLAASYHENLKNLLLETFFWPELSQYDPSSNEFKNILEGMRSYKEYSLQAVFSKLYESKCTIL